MTAQKTILSFCTLAFLLPVGCGELSRSQRDESKKVEHPTLEHETASPALSTTTRRFTFPASSSPFDQGSVALDTTTGQLCKTYNWQDSSRYPRGLPLCLDLSSFGSSKPGDPFAQFGRRVDRGPDNSQLDIVQHPVLGPLKFPKSMPFNERNALIQRYMAELPFLGAQKAYLGFTYIFDGTKWTKGGESRKYKENGQFEPMSSDQYDPLGVNSKEEKAKTILSEQRIRKVAEQFGVSYEDAREEAQRQGYQVPSKK